MKLCNLGHTFDYELEKLIRIFLPFEKIEILHDPAQDEKLAVCRREIKDGFVLLESELVLFSKNVKKSQTVRSDIPDYEKTCERILAVGLFECFAELTGYRSQWGILTGVRPAKLFSRLSDSIGIAETEKYFKEELKVSENKISLCRQAVNGEKSITGLSRPESFSLYLSVPFCPSRCSYCSFVSHSVDKAEKLIEPYVELLCRELEATAKIAKEAGLRLETVYMGGGTPTTLSADQLQTVLSTVNREFDISQLREYTVEAGRPDTVTYDKLCAIKRNNVTRISINPQTLNDNVLETIGRKHTAKQTLEAFFLARECGFDNINMDLIAGLPGDDAVSFSKTLDKILELSPESVTVHSLSMKRASSLSVNGVLPEIEAGNITSKMVDDARLRLTNAGITPYYMYRQSKTVGNLENVGYAKKGYEGLYNVYIMDETHTILACGASAVTKLREPGGEHIERIFNFKYPYEYISRFDEQILRKEGIRAFYERHPASNK